MGNSFTLEQIVADFVEVEHRAHDAAKSRKKIKRRWWWKPNHQLSAATFPLPSIEEKLASHAREHTDSCWCCICSEKAKAKRSKKPKNGHWRELTTLEERALLRARRAIEVDDIPIAAE